MVNNPYYQNWFSQQTSQMQTGQLKGRPVASIEEVKASTIEFDGSVFFFPDLGNKKIYTKQINIDGTSTINMYELKPIPQAPVVNSSQYVTRDEFETVLSSLQQELSKLNTIPAAAEVQSTQQPAQQAPQTAPPQEYKF